MCHSEEKITFINTTGHPLEVIGAIPCPYTPNNFYIKKQLSESSSPQTIDFDSYDVRKDSRERQQECQDCFNITESDLPYRGKLPPVELIIVKGSICNTLLCTTSSNEMIECTWHDCHESTSFSVYVTNSTTPYTIKILHGQLVVEGELQ
jgi:hypothetical protein